MSFFVQYWRAIVRPGCSHTGVSRPAFFSLYCIAKALGRPGPQTWTRLLGSLSPRVLATVTVNILSLYNSSAIG